MLHLSHGWWQSLRMQLTSGQHRPAVPPCIPSALYASVR